MSRTDRLIELCEKGFTLLDDADIDGAARQLELAQRIDARHPDVLRLDAELAAVAGDAERALELYTKVAELVPQDATPLISAAYLQLYSRQDPDAALALLDRALELVDDEDTLVDAVLLRTDALLAADRTEEARATLGELASSAIDDPFRVMTIGEAHLMAGDPAGALRWFDKLRDVPELATDALYASGAAHEALGDDDAKVRAWVEVRARDAAAPWPEWHLSPEEFEEIAQAAFDELPARARELLRDVPILIGDLPAEGLVADDFDPRALGLIDGPNLREQSSTAAAPVNIFLYQKNLEASFEDPDELAEQIRVTVLHETAHYFGLDEDELEALGLD